MKQISIIVPVYHGRKYIQNMIRQIEACAVAGKGRYALELLFVNDDPSESLENCVDNIRREADLEKIRTEIRVLETDRNRGIHAARIYGLSYSRGEYLLFLDQDDKIADSYFVSQLDCLGEKDAAVCKLLHEGRQFYDTRMPFENVIQKEYFLAVRNPIISPGQVLIRRDKIPHVWRNTSLQNNGADDWLLWLCMLGEGRSFALNPEILFEHVVDGSNESMNVRNMMDSEQEVYDVVSEYKVFSGEELQRLRTTVKNAADGHLQILCKFQKMFFVYDDWMKLQEQGLSIHRFLQGIGVERIAIYGDSYIGKRLYHNLKENGIRVLYFIDRNAQYLEEEIPVCLPDKGLPATDMIIISLVDGINEIRKSLSDLSDARILGIAELLADMKAGLCRSESARTGEEKAL